jgi:hypothetical protein
LILQLVNKFFLPTTTSLQISALAERRPPVPFWELLFKNIRVFFLGSDYFPAEAKVAVARELNAALDAGWPGFVLVPRSSFRAAGQAPRGSKPASFWESVPLADLELHGVHERVVGHGDGGREGPWTKGQYKHADCFHSIREDMN